MRSTLGQLGSSKSGHTALFINPIRPIDCFRMRKRRRSSASQDVLEFQNIYDFSLGKLVKLFKDLGDLTLIDDPHRDNQLSTRERESSP